MLSKKMFLGVNTKVYAESFKLKKLSKLTSTYSHSKVCNLSCFRQNCHDLDSFRVNKLEASVAILVTADTKSRIIELTV